jgi:hypothetical protein
MQTEISEPNEQKVIREEIQSLKDRINLIEAILDIKEWRKTSSNSTDFDRIDEELDSIV